MKEPSFGASIDALRHHYDVGNEFFRLWLDETMTYSCALWQEGDTLETAQVRKLDYHLDLVRARNAERLLDIGSGWGSLLQRAVEVHGIQEGVGLTLSREQQLHAGAAATPGITHVVEAWEEHSPERLYDAIISLGAMEHFVQPGLTRSERVDVYRSFFDKCSRLLKPHGYLSLQTVAWGFGDYKRGSVASIFPESDLPRLEELLEASGKRFELLRVRNDRLDYIKTCSVWLERLRANRAEATRLVGAGTFDNYEQYLSAAIRGFERRVFYLYRITLQKLGWRRGEK